MIVQLSSSHWAVIQQLFGSHQAVIWQSSGCHQAFIRLFQVGFGQSMTCDVTQGCGGLLGSGVASAARQIGLKSCFGFGDV